MKNISKFKVDNFILIPLFLFVIISISTIYSAQNILPSYLDNLYIKQSLWYGLGFLLAYFIMFIGNEYIYRNAFVLYLIGIVLLLGLFPFGTSINDAKCWYVIPGIGTFQPSEFMKIILIVTLATMIKKFNEQFSNPSVKEEFFFLIKIGLVVGIPSILTFLQPDTGVVLIYLLITLTMLFVSGIRYRWFGFLVGIGALIIGSLLAIYLTNQDLFVSLFGTDFFLRMDRLLDWKSGSGFQLENGMNAIGSSGMLGHGFGGTPIYFPEAQTDFIFAVYASNFGFLGSIFLLAIILFFHIKLINVAMNSRNLVSKYVIAGIVGMLLYQQIQNIGMTFGLMPITGITLPFISYGGSSLLSYMIMAGLIFTISNESMRYTN